MRKILLLWICSATIASLFITCGPKLRRYYTDDNVNPRSILVKDQLLTLQTNKQIGNSKPIFVELRLMDGNSTQGRLLSLSRDSVKVSQGYFYKEIKGITTRMERAIHVPKSEIMLMKIY